MKTVVLPILWAASLYRVRISLRGPHTMWRWSFTVAIFLVALGSTAWTFPAKTAQALGPSTGSLVTHLATIGAGGAVSVYLLTLLHDRPRTRWVVTALSVPLVAAVVEYIAWVRSPVHDRDYPDIARANFTDALLAYSVAYYGYLLVVLLLTCGITLRLAARRSSLSQRGGLLFIALGTLLGSLCLMLFVNRAVARFEGRDALALAQFGDSMAPLALLSLAAGTILFLAGPHLETWLWSRRLSNSLEPLWLRLRELFPAVRLDGPAALDPRQRGERMMIEIHDALPHVRVDQLRHGDLYRDVASAIQKPTAVGIPAAELLPPAMTRTEDERMLMRLSRAYMEVERAQQSTTPSR